ncbi:UNKNOWN [Stylonychia lemnae]|uniref:Uncharacterized protein n=1 Tax=Stylonychia lemnae TaxID=5949 RepID=A0A078AJU2_STYLE|nr:UNKNOWN [Stylonychia lemnae]|eukprot:CDW82650.1 UNKNOWN [Stylonychia lemnae]
MDLSKDLIKTDSLSSHDSQNCVTDSDCSNSYEQCIGIFIVFVCLRLTCRHFQQQERRNRIRQQVQQEAERLRLERERRERDERARLIQVDIQLQNSNAAFARNNSNNENQRPQNRVSANQVYEGLPDYHQDKYEGYGQTIYMYPENMPSQLYKSSSSIVAIQGIPLQDDDKSINGFQ